MDIMRDEIEKDDASSQFTSTRVENSNWGVWALNAITQPPPGNTHTNYDENYSLKYSFSHYHRHIIIPYLQIFARLALHFSITVCACGFENFSKILVRAIFVTPQHRCFVYNQIDRCFQWSVIFTMLRV